MSWDDPEGRLAILIILFRLIKESQVPLLRGEKLPEGKVLLVFYESGYGSCKNEIMILKSNYLALKRKSYEVISISADLDKDVFEDMARTFPWQAKYCDLQ